MSKRTKLAIAVGSAIVTAGMSASTVAQSLPETSAVPAQPTAVDVQAQAAPLAQAILGELRNPAYTTAEDYEGAILFVIDQQDYAVEVALAALDIADAAPDLNEAQKLAIARVKEMLRRRTRGTGAILGGAGGGFGGGAGFAFPVVGIGGGSSNYDQ